MAKTACHSFFLIWVIRTIYKPNDTLNCYSIWVYGNARITIVNNKGYWHWGPPQYIVGWSWSSGHLMSSRVILSWCIFCLKKLGSAVVKCVIVCKVCCNLNSCRLCVGEYTSLVIEPTPGLYILVSNNQSFIKSNNLGRHKYFWVYLS